MNILQVSPSTAYPPTTGAAQRMNGLMEARRESDTVRRVVTVQQGYSADHGGTRVEIDDNFVEHRIESLSNSILGVLTGRSPPLFISEILSVAETGPLDRWIEEADAIVAEYPWMFPYLSDAAPATTPIVFSSHDFGPELHSYLRDSVLKQPLYRRLETIEKRAAGTADLVLVTSERDKRKYEHNFDIDNDFHIAPSAAGGVAATGNASTSDATDGCTAIFVGTQHWPNVSAVETLLDVAPATPDVDYNIVGDVCDEFTTTGTPANVELKGFVDDLDAEYSSADIALNPITDGGGTNVKMVEYFGHGLAVVSTRFGARGIPATAGEHYVETDVAGLDEAIRDLRSDPERRHELGENSLALVQEELNWTAVSEAVFDEIRALEGVSGTQ